MASSSKCSPVLNYSEASFNNSFRDDLQDVIALIDKKRQ